MVRSRLQVPNCRYVRPLNHLARCTASGWIGIFQALSGRAKRDGARMGAFNATVSSAMAEFQLRVSTMPFDGHNVGTCCSPGTASYESIQTNNGRHDFSGGVFVHHAR